MFAHAVSPFAVMASWVYPARQDLCVAWIGVIGFTDFLLVGHENFKTSGKLFVYLVEGDALGGRPRLRSRERHAQDGVRAHVSLVVRPVLRDHRLVVRDRGSQQ